MNLDDRIPLPDGYNLILNDKTYVISGKPIGTGGSSIVYKGFINNVPVIIKELFPKDDFLGLDREPTYSIVIPDNANEAMKRYRNRAKLEYDVLTSLRLTDNGQDIDTWFKTCHKPIQANNTLYTIIDCEFGDMLEDMMLKKNKNQHFQNIPDICECILRVLEALEPVHVKGYRHLDIAPNNLHVLKQAIDGKRIINLIDFNSAYNPNNPDMSDRTYTKKDGYSAQELLDLCGLPYVQTDKLPPATDLYSVVVIFFELLLDRVPNGRDLKKINNGQLLSSYFENLPSVAIKKAHEILQKGLITVASSRYQDVPELKTDIKELRRLAVEIYLANNIPGNISDSEYMQRDGIMQNITQILNQHRWCNLVGMGGIGKSVVARAFAQQEENNYITVCFTVFDGSFVTTIANLSFENDISRPLDIEERYRENMQRLIRCDNKTLIIFDNFDADLTIRENDRSQERKQRELEILEKLQKIQAHILFTTRHYYRDSSNLRQEEIEIKPLPDKQLKMLFFENCRQAMKYESLVEEVIQITSGHTLTVVLVARLIAVQENITEQTISDVINILSKSLTNANNDKVINHYNLKPKEGSVYKHINALFNYSTISEEGLLILRCLCIVPPTGILEEDFKSLHNGSQFEHLMRSGWVTKSGNYIFLHPIIADMMFYELKPLLFPFPHFSNSKCGKFGLVLREKLGDTDLLWEDKKYYYNICKNYCEKVKQKENLYFQDMFSASVCSNECKNYGSLLYDIEDKEFISNLRNSGGISKIISSFVSWYDKSIDQKHDKILDKINNRDDKKLRKKYSQDYTQKFLNSNEYAKAIECILYDLPRQEQKLPFSMGVVTEYLSLSEYYRRLGDFQNAFLMGAIATNILKYKNETITKISTFLQYARQLWDESTKPPEYTNDAYKLKLFGAIKSNMYVLNDLGYYQEVQQHLEQMLPSWSKSTLIQDNIAIADAYRLLFNIYIEHKQLDKATSLFEYISVAESKRNIELLSGNLYLAQGDAERAKHHFLNAHSLFLDNAKKLNQLGECIIFNALSRACIANQEYYEALSYTEKINNIIINAELGPHMFTASYHERRGDIFFALKDFDQAEREYIRNRDLLQKSFTTGLTDDTFNFTHPVLTYAIKISERYHYAEDTLDSLQQLCFRPQHPDLLRAYKSLECLYKEVGATEKAESLIKQKESLFKYVNLHPNNNIWWDLLGLL
ncbi:MAG: NB-ARC domain-containing protein [Defluviitaleaceae bacterium]|nr:NB-ARC domain-containing protein [Defluviitaleaceae bacterium]